jgi:hypothetical protein
MASWRSQALTDIGRTQLDIQGALSAVPAGRFLKAQYEVPEIRCRQPLRSHATQHAAIFK